MGFFSNILKSINPVEQIKNPKKTFKTMAVASVDPGGTLIRTGRGVKQNWQNTVDPLNATIAAPPKPTVPYQPGTGGRGMWMGPQGPTIAMPNNTQRQYVTHPLSMGGSPPPPPTGMAPPTRIPMPVNSAPKMNPQMQNQMALSDALRARKVM